MEQFANFSAASTVGSGGYTAGSLVLNVASTSGFPVSPTFTVVIQDQATLLSTVVLRVTAVNSGTQFAVIAESADVDANAGDIVYAVLSAASLVQTAADAFGFDTLANRPASAKVGNRFIASDAAVDEFRWNGSSWDAFVAGMLCNVPQISDFGTSIIGATHGARTVWADQGGAGGGVCLAATSSDVNNDYLVGQFRATPATPYNARFRFWIAAVPGSKFEWAGVALRESGSGKLMIFGQNQDSLNIKLRGGYWNSPTSFSGTTFLETTVFGLPGRGGLWELHIKDDGSNRTLYICTDGVNKIQFYQVSNATFLTPDQIGILLAPYDRTLQITLVDYTVT